MALVKLIYKKGKLRLREIKCLPWGTQLVRGRYAIHCTSAYFKLDPSWSLPCQGKAGARTYTRAWTCSKNSRVIYTGFLRAPHSVLLYKGLSKLMGPVGSVMWEDGEEDSRQTFVV